jgi:hypothetical protein
MYILYIYYKIVDISAAGHIRCGSIRSTASRDDLSVKVFLIVRDTSYRDEFLSSGWEEEEEEEEEEEDEKEKEEEEEENDDENEE